jgi:hypothetical protein
MFMYRLPFVEIVKDKLELALFYNGVSKKHIEIRARELVVMHIDWIKQVQSHFTPKEIADKLVAYHNQPEGSLVVA